MGATSATADGGGTGHQLVKGAPKMHLPLLDDTAVLRAAQTLSPPAGSRRRVLLVATAPPALRDLFAFAGARGDPRAIEVYVLCPPLHGLLRQWTSDVWPARRRAAETL